MSAGASYRSTDGVIEVMLHRDERCNALGPAEWAVLDAAIAEAEGGAGAVMVMRGEGEFFCAGVDVQWIEERSKSGDLPALIQSNTGTLKRLESLSQLVITALNGPAIGIGAHLALCGDIVLATRSSYLAFPEARLGIPDVMHFSLLEQRLGRTAALDMILLGERMSAAEAATRGVVGHVYDDADALQRAVSDYLGRLQTVAPGVRRAVKAAAGLRADAQAQVRAFMSVANAAAAR
jgi:2-(1,2-epoxy-1,2-dihydrophenyl)acetyl-CoA isomerase